MLDGFLENFTNYLKVALPQESRMIRWVGTDIHAIDVNATDNPLVTVDVYHSNSNGLLEGGSDNSCLARLPFGCNDCPNYYSPAFPTKIKPIFDLPIA